MVLRIAVVQPHTKFGAGARQDNVELAWQHATQAAQRGAQLVSFPESFPGAWRSPVTWTPVEEMCSLARELGIYLVAGFAEPLDGEGLRCYNSLSLIDPSGVEIGRYRRTTPAHAPWVYRGGRYWDFEWVNAVDLPVFHTEVGRIGLLICSEVYSPELCRILALKGAEVVLMPAGLMGAENPLFGTWRTLVWARAIENLVVTAISSNVIGGEGGLAMVCSPEHVLLESAQPGVHVTDVDLDRLSWLREARDDKVGPAAPWRTKPGLLRDWRRLEVLEANPLLLSPSRIAGEPVSRGSAQMSEVEEDQ